MGCATSNLDDEEAVQLCRDRRNFIKQAVQQRNKFASGHITYLLSLRRVARALCEYIEFERLEFFQHLYAAPPFTATTRFHPGENPISLAYLASGRNQHEKNRTYMVNHFRATENSSISVEEMPPENIRIEPFYPANDYFSTDASPPGTPFFSPAYDASNYPSTSHGSSQWNFMPDPFSSLNSYRHPNQRTHSYYFSDEESERMRNIREEEGIPDLEEDSDMNSIGYQRFRNTRREHISPIVAPKPVEKPSSTIDKVEAKNKMEKVNEVKELRTRRRRDVGVTQPESNAVELDTPDDSGNVGPRDAATEAPAFTAYMNRRPTNIGEVMQDLETQFIRICELAHEVAIILEITRGSEPSTSSNIGVDNPAVLSHTMSSQLSSSASSQASTSRNDQSNGSSNSEEAYIEPASHKATLGRLYLWEKKLYEEVKSGERVRIAYERKCMQMGNHDVDGAEPYVVDRTRVAIRDLQTQLKVSINSVEYIAKRIEVLRDQELHPQLVVIIHGLARMWRSMSECHQIQKQITEEAKLLILTSPSAVLFSGQPPPNPQPRLFRSAATLESSLRHWSSSLSAWTHAQRLYARALSNWIRRCAPQNYTATPAAGAVAPSPLLATLTPARNGGPPPPIYRVCTRWSRLVDSINEVPATESLEVLAKRVEAVEAAKKKEEKAEGTVERTEGEGVKVVVEGIATVIGEVSEMAGSAAQWYGELVRVLARNGLEGRV